MKSKYKYIVIGAGAGGLGAAAWLKEYKQDFVVIEGMKELPINLQNGVHYLHSKPNLPFDAKLKEITLTDGVIDPDGRVRHTATLNDALDYSLKVREVQHPSSILDIGKRDFVYLPSSNTMNTMLEESYKFAGTENFQFGWWLNSIDPLKKIVEVVQGDDKQIIEYEYLISSLPLNLLLKALGTTRWGEVQFTSNPIEVANFPVNKIVPNWLINLYIPDLNCVAYRASILNNAISLESVQSLKKPEILPGLKKLLGNFDIDFDKPEHYTWKTGKIISISTDVRREIVSYLDEQSIYSLGRFGLWNRKLLVDSTINQADKIVKYTAMSIGSKDEMINTLVK